MPSDERHLTHAVVDITDEAAVRALFEEIGALDHLFVTVSPPAGSTGAFLDQDVAAAQEDMNGKFFCWLDNMQKCVYTPSMQDHTRQPDLPEGIDAARFCACFNLRKTARAITQFYNAILQPSDLLATQFTLLAILAHDNPTPISALAEALGMDRTTLSRNLKPLQQRGLVHVAPDDTDHRVQLVTLTIEGRSALLAALPLWQQAQQQIVGQFGASRWHTLLADLAGMVAITHQ